MALLLFFLSKRLGGHLSLHEGVHIHMDRLIHKWSVKTSSMSYIEQILQFKVCQEDIII